MDINQDQGSGRARGEVPSRRPQPTSSLIRIITLGPVREAVTGTMDLLWALLWLRRETAEPDASRRDRPWDTAPLNRQLPGD